jgi:hypothetical protein
MKKYICLIPLLLLTARAQATTNQLVTLEWDYPPAELNQVTFTVYHSTDLSIPVKQWQPIGSLSGTNRVAVSIVPGVNYFTVSASNFWAEVFSNVASTPPLPRSDVNLRVKRQ